jgi:hypothetical protein
LDLFYLGLRVHAGLFQCLLDEEFDEASAVGRALPDADLPAAEFADIGDMFGAIPFEERRVPPTADDVNIGTLQPLTDGRLCVHRCGDVHAVLLDCESKRLAFRRARQEPAALVLVARKTFLLEKTLFLSDVNGDPVTNVVVHISDEKTLIENTHSDSPFPNSLFAARTKLKS